MQGVTTDSSLETLRLHLCVINIAIHCKTLHNPTLVCVIMSTPLGGGHIIFAFSAVRCPTWFPDILGNSSYPIFTKFGMQVYWINSLYGIAFGDDSSIAN